MKLNRLAACDDVTDVPKHLITVEGRVSAFARVEGGFVVAYSNGALVALADDGTERLRKKKSEKTSWGFSVDADSDGIYWGHSEGLTKLAWEGKRLWHKALSYEGPSAVLAGGHAEGTVVAVLGGAVMVVDKKSGKVLHQFVDEIAGTGVRACAVSADGETIFVASDENQAEDVILRFDGGKPSGRFVIRGPTSVDRNNDGVPFSLALLGEQLFVATGDGSVGPLDF